MKRIVLDPELLKEMEEEVAKIRKNLKETQDIHKSYADKHRVHREFNVGDHVYLRVREKKISLNLGSCAKQSPRHCGLFKVLERIGSVAYRLAFPTSTRAHNVLHVSFLKKYVHDPNHIIDWNVIQVEPEGEFQVDPICILNKKVALLWNRYIR